MSFQKTVRSKLNGALNSFKYRHIKTAKKFVKDHHCPPLTEEEKEEIDRYWATYNIRFKNYDWHRMFYSVTGVKDPRFIPQPLAGRVLYHYYNKQAFVPAYVDKNMFSFFLPRVRFPECLGKRMSSCFYDADDRYYGSEVTDRFVDKVWESLSAGNEGNADEIIIKQAVESLQGKGVKRIRVQSKQDLANALSEQKSENFAIQSVIRQHPFFEQFNKDSVNIIRITTFRKGDTVRIFSPCIRFGIQGSHTDVAFKDGKEIVNVIGIDPASGRIADEYDTLDGERIKLPEFPDKTVPQWEEIVNTVKTNALELKHFGIVAWDITVDDQNRVVCVEYNLKWPGLIVYQFAQGPFAGEYTDEFLEFLKDKKNRKLIPPCILKR